MRSRRTLNASPPNDASALEAQPALYYDRHFGVNAAKLLPGQYYVTDRGLMLFTVLGSCVAACVRDVVSGIGGMNHFMLPEQSGQDPVGASARYGTYAMEVLVNELFKRGAQRENLEAKVFGGGNVVRGMTASNVGRRNAQFVRRYMAEEGIRVVAEDLEDTCARKVYFFPRTGQAFIKSLYDVNRGAGAILKSERDYERRLHQTQVSGDIELF